mmetsp:Transcript_7506/g.19093  ORF Transcript_7506/g.19093 Transcript_7506/m.19093 type:complete len:82 (-) Transcript_7506:141-386(-)
MMRVMKGEKSDKSDEHILGGVVQVDSGFAQVTPRLFQVLSISICAPPAWCGGMVVVVWIDIWLVNTGGYWWILMVMSTGDW